MIQLSNQSPKIAAIKFDSAFAVGTSTNSIYLKLTNQYTQKEYMIAVGITTYTTGRGTWMIVNSSLVPVGTYIIKFIQVGSEKLLATQLAYISGADVIGESAFKSYTTGDSNADVVYPNT